MAQGENCRNEQQKSFQIINFQLLLNCEKKTNICKGIKKTWMGAKMLKTFRVKMSRRLYMLFVLRCRIINIEAFHSIFIFLATATRILAHIIYV